MLALHSVVAYGYQDKKQGVIKGKITDKATGEALPGVSIAVKGTYKGAVSDIDGNFLIRDVGSGTYTVDITLIGYKEVEYASLAVKSGDTTTINTKLEQTVLNLGQEVVIYGEKPLFNIEETQSTHTTNSKDLQVNAVTTMQDIVALQPGVIQGNGEIHIRGGRTYENAYLVDGISVQDPLSGTGFGLQVSPDAIQDVEVITGGYNAEYGQATSGIVSVTTKDGSDHYTGTFSTNRDHFGFNDNSRSDENTDIAQGTLSGPEPIFSYLLPSMGITVPGTVSFFATGFMNLSDDYTRWVENVVDGVPEGWRVATPGHLFSSLFPNSSWLSPRADNAWSGFAKFTWKPSSTTKLTYAYDGSIGINQDDRSVATTLEYVTPAPGYQYDFENELDSGDTYTLVNVQQSIAFTQTLNPSTFYEIHLSRYSAHVRADVDGKYYTQYDAPEDLVTLPVQYYNQYRDTIGVIPGNGFYTVGDADEWRDQSTITYTVKGDFTHDFSENHRFKTGFESDFQDMQMIDILDPWYKPYGLYNDIYAVHPALGDLYAQEEIKMRGMILNYGLRFDYWFPGKYVDDMVNLPYTETNIPLAVHNAYLSDTYDIFGRRMKARLSPRLGVSHPVSDNQSLFFSYGHFSKFPRSQFVYTDLLRSTSLSSSQVIGNPDLNPETTVAYELGLRNQLTPNDVLTVTAYYKDVFDYITAEELEAQQSRFAGGSYTTYVNQDYSRDRGIELEYKKRFADWFNGSLSGSYSVATGKSSTADQNIYNLEQGLTPTLEEEPAVYDRPLQVTLTLDFSSRNDGSFLGGYEGFVKIFYESGYRYTPDTLDGYNPQNGRPLYVPDYNLPYSSVASPWFYINLTLMKHVNVGFAKLVATLNIMNILNRENPQIINPVTGRAYQYGDPTESTANDPLYPQLTAPISPYPYNPARYLTPRTAQFGLSLAF